VGVVMDLATHDLDIMRYLTGNEVMHVYAETKRVVHTTSEDLFVGILRFKNGTIGLLEINWLTPTKIRELYITGERGMYWVNYITQDICFFENEETNGNEWSALSVFRGVSEGSMVKYAIKKKEPLRAELEAFISRVQGNDTPITNGDDAHAALVLATSLVESAGTGQVKEIVSNGIQRNPCRDSISRRIETEFPASPATQTIA
jgi:predicted dehydrogenase